MQALQQNPEVTNTQVVTKALFNVKQQLNLSNHVIGEIIGDRKSVV